MSPLLGVAAMKIKFFTTGGTIDKVYFDATSEFEVGPPQVREILQDSNVGFEYEIESILRKDSLDMTEKDRELIRQRVLADACPLIVVTHGTDTMVETASILGKSLKEKTVVLVGALIPYAFGASDALFNLGCAFSAVQALSAGIYLTMNGKIFTWNHVRKNKKSGEFEEI